MSFEGENVGGNDASDRQESGSTAEEAQSKERNDRGRGEQKATEEAGETQWGVLEGEGVDGHEQPSLGGAGGAGSARAGREVNVEETEGGAQAEKGQANSEKGFPRGDESPRVSTQSKSSAQPFIDQPGSDARFWEKVMILMAFRSEF